MINSDLLLSRLRERVTEPRDDYDGHGDCPNCGALLTVTDVIATACTQCGCSLEIVDDESVDEHLHEGTDLNGWELGYDD